MNPLKISEVSLKVCFVARPGQSITPEAASRLMAKNAIRRLSMLIGGGAQ